MADYEIFDGSKTTQQEDFSHLRTEYAKLAEQMKALSIVNGTIRAPMEAADQKERDRQRPRGGREEPEVTFDVLMEQHIREDRAADILKYVMPVVEATTQLNRHASDVRRKWDVIEPETKDKWFEAFLRFQNIDSNQSPSAVAKIVAETTGKMANAMKACSNYYGEIAQSKFVAAKKPGELAPFA